MLEASVAPEAIKIRRKGSKVSQAKRKITWSDFFCCTSRCCYLRYPQARHSANQIWRVMTQRPLGLGPGTCACVTASAFSGLRASRSGSRPLEAAVARPAIQGYPRLQYDSLIVITQPMVDCQLWPSWHPSPYLFAPMPAGGAWVLQV